MKKIFMIVLVSLLVLSLATPAYCQGPFRKLGRGIWNFITSPLEILNRFEETRARSGYYEAFTYGLCEGACMVGFRAAMGFYEVITFPVPIPAGYKPILSDPEFFWKVKPKSDENIKQ